MTVFLTVLLESMNCSTNNINYLRLKLKSLHPTFFMWCPLGNLQNPAWFYSPSLSNTNSIKFQISSTRPGSGK